MVARPQGRVKWLAALGLAALLVQGISSARRLPPAEEFTETGVVSETPTAATAPPQELRFQLTEEAEQASLDEYLAGHRGLGTVADPILEGPAGVRVNLQGGDLVWHRSFLPHGVPDPQLAFSLSYDRAHAVEALVGDSAAMPPGWRHGHQREVRPGSWGIIEVVEDDGFVQHLHLLGEDQEIQRDALIDTLVSLRRMGRPPPGEAVPSGPGFRQSLEQDPEFLEEMRARFIGAGAGPRGRYGGRARGHAVLWIEEDGSALLRRHDGALERYDGEGQLMEIERPGAPGVVVERDRHGIAAISLDVGPRLQLSRDGAGRLVRVEGAAGRDVALEYKAGQLSALRTPEGTWAFGYDETGRVLTSVTGPRDWARIEYDADTGRVVSLEGPSGTTRVEYGDGRPVTRTVARGPAATVEVTFDADRCERWMAVDGRTSTVRFDGAVQLPIQVDETTWTWDDAGHLVAISSPVGTLEVEVDGDDRPQRIVGPAGSIQLEVDEAGQLAGLTDDAGVSLTYRYDAAGRLVREGIGGRNTAIHHGLWGEVERVTLPGGDAYTVRRDAAGRPLGLSRSTGGEMRLRWDDADRLVGVDPPGPGQVDIAVAERGGVRVQDARGTTCRAELGNDGRLREVRRDRPALGVTLDTGTDGLPEELLGTPGWTLRVQREAGQVTGLLGGPGRDVLVQHGEQGLEQIEVGGARWTVGRDAAGRAVRLQGGGGRDLVASRDHSGALVALARGLRAGFVVQRDAAGRPSRLDPASGTSWTLSRDAAGRVAGVVRDDEVLLRIERDSQGRVTAVVEGDDEQVWRTAHGLSGWPDGVEPPSGAPRELEIDSRGRLVRYLPPEGDEWTATWSLWGDLEAWSPGWGGWSLVYSEDGSVASIRAGDVGRREYRWGSRSLELEGDGAVQQLHFDPHGRWTATTRGEEMIGEWGAELGPAGELVAWVRGDGSWTVVRDSLGRLDRVQHDRRPDALQLRWGVDGLLSGWEVGGRAGDVERDALGRVLEPQLAVDNAAGEGDPAALQTWLAPGRALDPIAAVLFGPYLSGAAGPDREAIPVGPTTPRWVEDRLRVQQEVGWASLVAAPPGDDLPLPGTLGEDTVTVPGLLTLLGFLPGDLADHRTLVAAEAPPVTVRCPALDELRALHAAWSATPGVGAVAMDPQLGGVALLPDGAPVGHPTPWAAVIDPWALRDPAAELLGVRGVPPAVAGLRRGEDGHEDGLDRDPLAEPLRLALDHGRWLSARPTPTLAPARSLSQEMAGGIGLWTASRVQLVFDGRGRVRGVDAGSTATATWNRLAVEALLAPACLDGDAGAMPPPAWLPTPGAAPERSLGLRPGPGPLWPDTSGTSRVAR